MAVVSGEVYIDANQDGLKQAGEAGAADVRVYLDQNTNGRLDATEASTLTDADGLYSFPTVSAGNYEVRLAPEPGFVQTAPALTFGWNDTVVQDSNGDYFRAAQLFQVDLDGNVESIGQPTRSRMDGLVRVRDDSLIAIDSRTDEIFNVNPYSGERIRVAESNLDLVGGVAYDRVGNTVYTLIRDNLGTSTRSLARLDINTGTATVIGGGYEGLNNVTDIEFDASNERVIGFDNNDDEFFAFDLNGAARTLARSLVTTIDPDTGATIETGKIDADSMALATSEQLVDVLPNGPVDTSTYVWMFDADDNGRTSTLLVEIPDAAANVVETAIVMDGIDVSEPVRAVALTRSAVGNNPRNISVTSFESRGGVNFGIAADVIGFRVTPSNPLTGPGALSQSGVTVVGGAVGADFVEVTLNREPASNVVLDLSIESQVGGDPGVILDTNQLVFTPDDWTEPRRIMLSPDPNDPVAVVTPSVLTVSVDEANSDSSWQNLADQSLPVRTLPEVDPDQFSTPVINEVLVDGWASLDVSETTDQYIELRGQPNEVLPEGTYFVVIEEASSRIGEVNTVIDLSGQSFGANGFLVLLQAGHTYSTAFGANVLESDESGFNGLPGGIYSSSQSDGSIDTLFSNSSYFLIQSDTAPVVGLDIDTNNDGFIDPASPAVSWDTYDAVAMHEFSFYEASFAPIVFIESFSDHHRSVTTNSRGQTLVQSEGFGYVGRIGDSIGSDENDWVYGSIRDVEPGFWGGESDPEGLFEFYQEHVSYPALFDHALDHVGESNFVGGVRGQITLLPSAGDILNGISADTRLPAEGVTVFVDTNGNGVRDNIVKVIEPNELLVTLDANDAVSLDDELSLTQEVDGVTISWDRSNGTFVTDDIVSARQSVSGQVVGNRIFAAGPFDTFFGSSDTLRFDFFQPVTSVSIDVINWSSSEFTTVYGRLDAYNADGQLVASTRSEGVSGTRRSTITVSAPGEEIVRVQAYGDSGSASFDTLRYVQPEAAAVTDENGIYEISGLFPGNYELAVS
ncbi:protocadherin Fat-like protein, partial [Rhodopirellula sallentina SM41]